MRISKPRRPHAVALGATLAGSALLAAPAFAMDELAQGYALAADAPPTTGKIPPVPEPAPPVDKQAATTADNRHAEGKCGADAAAEPKANAGKAEATKDAAADKGMEGKCGEGKCGAGT